LLCHDVPPPAYRLSLCSFLSHFSSTATSLLVLPQRFIDERQSLSLKCLGWHLGSVRYPSSATFIHTVAFHIPPVSPERPLPPVIGGGWSDNWIC
jgi:hypothetical protein